MRCASGSAASSGMDVRLEGTVTPSLRGLTQPGAGQCERGLEARGVVLELELAAMQARDRGGEAQAEARTRLRAAAVEPHEPFYRPRAIRLGDTRPGVGYREQHALALRLCRDDDRCVRVAGMRLRRRILDCIVDQIGESLTDQF